MHNVSGYQKLKLQNEALLKTLEAERDPENLEKRLAAEAAQAAFLDATNTVGSAIAKALTEPNRQLYPLAAALPHLIANPEVRKAIEEEQARDRAAFEKRLAADKPTETLQDAIAKALGQTKED